MSFLRDKRHYFIGGGLLASGLLLTAVLARVTVAGFTVGLLLKQAGASEVAYRVTRVTPWRLVVEDVEFLLKARAFAAKRVSFARAHWWSPSLGRVRVEQARLPLALEPLGADAGTETSLGPSPAVTGRPKLPVEELSVDGRIVVQVAGVPDQTLTVELMAKQGADNNWGAQVQVNAPGLALAADATYDLATAQLDFTVPSLTLDLKTWQDFARHVVPMPATEGWAVEGKFSGRGAGRFAGSNLTANGTLQVRDGRATNAAKAITAEGVELDLEFVDLAKVVTKPGTLRVRELQNPQVPLSALTMELAFNGPDEIEVNQATLRALGGTVSAEPFVFSPSRDNLHVVVLANEIRIEEIMALTKDLPAKAAGRVNGRFPLNLGPGGIRLGTGWLMLTPGVDAEITFAAKGLLTNGTSPKSPSYSVLEKIESGLLKLRISELRLDFQPPDAPAGRSATLHLVGAPVDPGVKAPVILDLNVNGPLEKLLRLGTDPRLGSKARP